MKNIYNLHFWFLMQYLQFVLFGTIVIFVFLQIYIFAAENPVISLEQSLYFTLFVFIIFSGMTFYLSSRASYLIKSRLDRLAAYVTTLSGGRYAERIERVSVDEIGLIEEELNNLAGTMQEQLKSLQRIATERSTLEKQAQQAAIIEERQRFARDLHDSVSQQLFALNMLSSAAVRLIDKKPNEARPIIFQVSEIAEKAQGEMRALLLHLRPIDLKGESLKGGLLKLIEELEKKTPIQFELKLQGMEEIPETTDAHLFRVVQEAISNILRHAQASKIQMRSEIKGAIFHLFIGDDGQGFDVSAEKWTSYGLQTMRERCEEIGGTFEVRSKKGEGTYINIRIHLLEQ
ncbi:HAMP domain-containing sensor histidine kinase [Jeotgalibacillus soli]|uniref:histidine kinase n=1 Tax=Jeotgalibacillus soli TaxID=889306 RepID=A0A0C2R5S9_9BACL|nr:sensor histidine kinase [Jeotgalibacillus soli]KIL45610.1 histidine kinase [Jeotgalibacillus soli]